MESQIQLSYDQKSKEKMALNNEVQDLEKEVTNSRVQLKTVDNHSNCRCAELEQECAAQSKRNSEAESELQEEEEILAEARNHKQICDQRVEGWMERYVIHFLYFYLTIC